VFALRILSPNLEHLWLVFFGLLRRNFQMPLFVLGVLKQVFGTSARRFGALFRLSRLGYFTTEKLFYIGKKS